VQISGVREACEFRPNLHNKTFSGLNTPASLIKAPTRILNLSHYRVADRDANVDLLHMSDTKNQQKTGTLLSGNEALARGAWEAGVNVAAAYPGTPSTEILETLGTFDEVDAQWSTNEKTAYEVAYGTAVGGKRALFACKHVGLNVAMDPFMTSIYTGVNAGLVAVIADDPGLHSSQNEQDTHRLMPFAKCPMLEPATPREAYDYAKIAFDLSEKFDTPVVLRMTTRVSHSKENFTVGERTEVPQKKLVIDPRKYVMVPGNAGPRHVELEKRLVALKEYSESTPVNRVISGSKKLGILTAGVAAMYAREAFPEASFLILGMPYPFPADKVRAFAKTVDKVVVVEELEPFLAEQARLAGVEVSDKHPSYRIGELRPELIDDVVNGCEKKFATPTARKPQLCPGCPHRATFAALKRLRCTVTGDIGCYTLGATAPLGSLHTQSCMGASIPFLQGFGKCGAEKVVAVIGDSTFVHTGIPGLINAAYNGATGVILILDNGTTAMTGTQPNPATGVTLKGQPTKRLILEDVCKACGADTVDVITPFDNKALQNLVSKRLAEKKLSVIISRANCRLIEKMKKPVVKIDKKKCIECSICINLGCPALSKAEDGAIRVDDSLCPGCGLCTQMCPKQAMTVEG
jgi:indolepyruvate ferredoxin oxidoreductase alpha subunit